jgi:hypothetical protein
MWKSVTTFYIARRSPMVKLQHTQEQGDVQRVLRELLSSYVSLVPLCRGQGLDVAEMQGMITRAERILAPDNAPCRA